MKIPEPLLNFFGTLFNFKPESYSKAARNIMTDDIVSNISNDNDNDDDMEDDMGDDMGEANDVDDKDHSTSYGNISPQRCRKIQSVFQIMH